MPDPNVQENQAQEQELILGKFKTQDALASAYQELEKKFRGEGTTQTPPDNPVNEVTPDSPETPETPLEASETGETPKDDSGYGEGIISALSGAGMDVNAVAAEYESEGGLKDETKQSLYGIFGQQVVDNYFSGLEAQAKAGAEKQSAEERSIIDAVGGDEVWQTVTSWANGPNADAESVEAFNAALDTGNAAIIKATAQALKGSYERANGTLRPSSVVTGTSASPSSSRGFESNAQMIQAINDPRYASDPAYRSEVQRRIGASPGLTVRS